jgi:hypothetical protein
MSTDRPQAPEEPQAETETKRIAREDGLSEEQVRQLARAVGGDKGDLSDVAGAAARWS